ncbi:MAG: hypothetical protein EB101_11495 [Chitinophagia bacterium]|nr:hypothetical protein [Chitinophagia bacterium]
MRFFHLAFPLVYLRTDIVRPNKRRNPQNNQENPYNFIPFHVRCLFLSHKSSIAHEIKKRNEFFFFFEKTGTD